MEEWAQKLSEQIWTSPIREMHQFETETRHSYAWLFMLSIKRWVFNEKYSKVKQL